MPRPIVRVGGVKQYKRSSIERSGAIVTLRSGQIVSISNYSPIPEQPGTARQIVVLGAAFAIVVAGLIAFNLILERVSLLDDLKKDVTALAQVHANHAEREISEYDSLLKALADRVRHGDGFGDLVAQRQSFDPALVEAPDSGALRHGARNGLPFGYRRRGRPGDRQPADIGSVDGRPARHPAGKQDSARSQPRPG